MALVYDEALKNEYWDLWLGCNMLPAKRAEAERIVAKIVKNEPRYATISKATGVPWYFIGALHSMESSCNFNTHLHNGDPLSARTVQVPAGRPKTGNPPFTFEESAIDALGYDGFIDEKDWCIQKMLYLAEKYNGWGYRGHNVPSPYLWAATTVQKPGKYVADGVWSDTAWSEQIGIAAIFEVLREDYLINFGNPPVPPAKNPATWFEVYRIDASTSGFIAYDGEGLVVESLKTVDKKKICEFLNKFEKANNVVVAPSGKAWPLDVKPEPKPEPVGEVYLKCTRRQPGKLDSRGLEVLDLQLIQGTEVLFAWDACSGQPWNKQTFLKGGAGEVAGSMYPCGQGKYTVENFRWYGGKDNWNASGGPGLGPIFIPFEPTFSTERGAYGIHFDENYGISPGTAGCIGINTIADMKIIVEQLRKYDPKTLIVDWAL